ncbi:hypothetical protein GCM10010873_26740 [Cypionkella aquatica]|uniref:Uncharacterized protein n=1 Tax=Cypionkella aquatica TaxID=1756042 RepID=A0AA37U6G4_9RHOB|nr:hypothetical protein [Cypionkella aquatica]GLS87700.1 hypothetical protein GCM10010873_26740 [Cypionkella aquatica]
MTITLDATTRTASMAGGTWSQTVPLADLPNWLALYRRLWSRLPDGKKPVPGKPGPWARFYDADVRALEAAVRQAQEM